MLPSKMLFAHVYFVHVIPNSDEFKSVADPEVGKSGHGPPSKLSMEFGPLGDRKSNDSIVKLSKCKDFGPPVTMSATHLTPNGKIAHLKHEKGR